MDRQLITGVLQQSEQPVPCAILLAVAKRYDFKTTYHKNPQLTTTYRQKAPIAPYVRRIDAQIAVRFCAICSIYIMPKAPGDISTGSILIGGCVFLFPKLVCAAILPRVYTHIAPLQNGGTHKLGE